MRLGRGLRGRGALHEGRADEPLLGQRVAVDARHEHVDGDAADHLESWLASAAATQPSRLETIALAGADPDELTLRAARLLGEADHIFHPPDTPAAILDRARADAVRHAAETPPADPPPGLSLWLDMGGATLR